MNYLKFYNKSDSKFYFKTLKIIIVFIICLFSTHVVNGQTITSTTIFNETGVVDGSINPILPTGWQLSDKTRLNIGDGGLDGTYGNNTNNIVSTNVDFDIVKNGYFLLENVAWGRQSTGLTVYTSYIDAIYTGVYDLSAYNYSYLTIDLGSYNPKQLSGSRSTVKVDISYDGGSTYTESQVFEAYINIYPATSKINFKLSKVSNAVKFKISNYAQEAPAYNIISNVYAQKAVALKITNIKLTGVSGQVTAKNQDGNNQVLDGFETLPTNLYSAALANGSAGIQLNDKTNGGLSSAVKTGNGSLFFQNSQNWGDIRQHFYVIHDNSGVDKNISFYWKSLEVMSGGGQLNVNVSYSLNNGISYTSLGDIRRSDGAWNNFSATLPGNLNKDIIIRFISSDNYFKTGYNDWIALDDLNISDKCSGTPIAGTITSSSMTSATNGTVLLSLTNSTANNTTLYGVSQKWQYYVAAFNQYADWVPSISGLTTTQTIGPYNNVFRSGVYCATTNTWAYTSPITIQLDNTAPTFTVKSISSNNSKLSTRAKVGDVISLSLTASEQLQNLPSVLIAGQTATVTGINSTTFTASYTVTNSTTQGVAAISISNYSDLSGNAGVTTSGTTDASSVNIDYSAPTISVLSIVSNNPNNASVAKLGDLITVNLTASESISLPTISIAGNTMTVTGSAGTYSATYLVSASSLEGGGISVLFEDVVGNAGTNVTSTTNGSNVIIDKTNPTILSSTLSWGSVIDGTEMSLSGTITATLAGIEDGVTISALINGISTTASVNSNSATFIIPQTTLGTLVNNTTYTVTITGTDLAGNSASSLLVNFSVNLGAENSSTLNQKPTISIPYYQNFESNGGAPYPSDWQNQIIYVSQTSSKISTISSSITPTISPISISQGSGSNIIKYESSNTFTGGTSTKERLVLPPFNTSTTTGNFGLNFYMFNQNIASSSNLAEGIQVEYTLDQGANWVEIPGAYFSRHNPFLPLNTGSWELKGVQLPSAILGNPEVYISLTFKSAAQQNIYIDDVSINEYCSLPTDAGSTTFGTAVNGNVTVTINAGSTVPTGYTVVRYSSGSSITNPSDGKIYHSGEALGLGTVVYSNTNTSTSFSFNDTGLKIGTYSYQVYPYSICALIRNLYNFSPVYNTSSPAGTLTLTACQSMQAVIKVIPGQTEIGGAQYSSLTNAINAIATCGITQPTIIELAGSYTSSTQVTLPTISGATSINTITIRPELSHPGFTLQSITVSPALTFSSTSYWIVDGRPGSQGSSSAITIKNTFNGAGPAISFASSTSALGSHDNTIKYAKILSNNNSISSGAIYFGAITFASATTGNSNNIVANCDISYASTKQLANAIYSDGASGKINNSNTISNNNIYDFFISTNATSAINLNTYNDNWVLSGNNFYQTSVVPANTANAFTIIKLGANVNGAQILNNYFGSAAADHSGILDYGAYNQQNGSFSIVTATSGVGTITPTSFQGNTVSDINISSKITTTHTLLNLGTGNFNIGNISANTFGSSTANDKLNFLSAANSVSNHAQIIYVLGSNNGDIVNINNNIFGGITLGYRTGASTGSTSTLDIIKIYSTQNGSGAGAKLSIDNNQIGFNTAIVNNISSGAVHAIYANTYYTVNFANPITNNKIKNINTNGVTYGIRVYNNRLNGNPDYTGNYGFYDISNNTIKDISSSSSISGIDAIFPVNRKHNYITNNLIANLESTTASTVKGIYSSTGAYGGYNYYTYIKNNKIYSLKVAGAGTLTGIEFVDDAAVSSGYYTFVANNMIRLGFDKQGNALTDNLNIYGIYQNNTVDAQYRIFSNSVYIGGSGTNASYAILTRATSTAYGRRYIQNNILFNERSGGASHFSLYNVTAPYVFSMFNNNYYSGSSSSVLIRNGGTTNTTTLTDVKLFDANAIAMDPKFVSKNGGDGVVDLHLVGGAGVVNAMESKGSNANLGDFNPDIDGQSRNGSTPDIGADEITASSFVPISITSISTSKANGTYGVGEIIPITVAFNSPVTVVGSPTISLNAGVNSTTAAAVYYSGSGTNTLTFNYTVAAGNQTNTLDYVSSNAILIPSGASINDAGGYPATTTLPAPGARFSKSIAIDAVQPALTSVTISSNNSNTAKAKPGDEITISITASESITLPTVTIAGQSATVTGTGGSYAATYTVNSNATDGQVGITISNYYDLLNNPGTEVTSSTNSSTVVIDKSVPILNAVTISSNNNSSSSKAKVGDVISVQLTSNEIINTPTISIAGNTISATGSGTSWAGTLTVTSVTTEGLVDVSINYSDLVGNSGSPIFSTTNSSYVGVDITSPSISQLTISSNNTNPSKAKAGDLITVNLTASETILRPTFSIAGNVITATGSGAVWSATYTVTSLTTSGFVNLSVSNLRDVTGNIISSVSSTTNSSTVEVDLIAPTISISSNPANLRSGQTSTITFALSEASNDFIQSDVTVSGGSLGNWNVVNGSTYTAEFTPTANSNANGVIEVAVTRFTDLAGNANSAASNTVTISIDNTLPTLNSISMSSSNANMSIAKIGDIVTVVLTASEPIQTPTITIAGQAATVTGTSSTYTATYTVSNTTPQGTASISVSYSDLAGNAGTTATSTTNSSAVLIDYTAPTGYAISINQTSVTLANQSSTSVNLTVAEVGTTYNYSVSIASNTITGTGTITNTSQTISNINVSSLPDGVLTYSVSLTDAAGNQGAAVTQTVSKDALPASISSVTTTAANGSYKAGQVIPVVVNFNKPVNVTGTPQITLVTGTSSATTAVNYSSGSGTSSLTFNYTIGASNTSTDLNYAATNSLSLNGGTIIDFGNNPATLTLPATNSANSLGGSANIVIDTQVPTVGSLVISSNNANSAKAKIGDIVTVVLTANEPIQAPTVTIAGQSATITGTSSTYTATYTVSNSTPQGNANISVSYSDLAGNAGTTVTSTTNSSNVDIDSQVPTLSAVSISSNNTTSGLAKSGNTISLTFTTSEGVFTPTITIAGQAVSTTSAGNTYTATATVTNSSVEGVAAISISFTDLSGNVGTTVTSTTNSSTVTIDHSSPTLSIVNIASNNVNSTKAKEGDVIAVTLTASESIQTPSITIAGQAATVTGSGNTYTGTYTVTNATPQGAVTISVSYSDLSGNAGAAVSSSTNSSLVTIDRASPTINNLSISSNNTSSTIAKVGDIVTVVLTASEPIQTPTITIAGQSATVTGTSSTYTATYTVSNTTPQGTASISVSYSDLAGNAGTTATSTTNSSAVLIDYTAPTGYAISINQASVTLANQSSTSVNLTGAEVGTTYNYSVSIASNTITGTGTIANTSQIISNINVSSLPDGVLTYSVSLTDAAGNQGAAVTQTVSKDALPASISSVTTTAPNGSYKAGQVIPVVVNFNKPVNVTGTPQITLITGTSSATTAVNYSSGTGTSSLTFNYTIGSSNTSTDLNYAATTSLGLNGGTIIDAGNNNATLTLPATNSANSLGGSANIVIDTQVPTVGSVVISSSNTNNTKAKVGDVVTVVLTTSEPIQTPTITVAGQAATVTGTSSTYTATYTVSNSTPEGVASIAVAYNDLAGNAGTTATTTTNASAVTVDKTAPVLNTVTVSSSNSNPALAKIGDIVTVTISSSEPINTPVVTIASNPISVTANTSTSFTGTYTVSNATTQGGSINITYSDVTGNIGTAVTSTTNSSTITIDRTAPVLNSVIISSNNANSTKAKVGDVITVSMTASETIQTPSITIAGQAATITGTSNTYTGTYIVANTTTEGNAAIAINYSDLSGNVGTQITNSTNSSTVVVDRTAPAAYTVAWIPASINNQNFRSVGFTLSNAELGATYTYTITSGTTSITATGTVTSTTQTLTGIDSYPLHDGLVTLSLIEKDVAGNIGTAVTATINKATNGAPTGTVLPITISQNDPNRVINLVQGLVDPDNDPLTVNSLQISYSLVNISNNQSLPISATRQAQFADVVSPSDLNGTNLSIETLKSKFLPANQKGVISISYIVTDGFNTVNESTQLEIIGANDQPTGNNVTINQVTVSGSNALVPLIEGLGVSSSVPGVDPDADSVSYVLAPSSNVQNGQFQFQPDGTFVFVPDNDYFGEQSFQYYVKDQSGIQQGPYTVKIVIRENPDVDGVPSLLEMLGTDNGDVNGDGIPDRKQNNITTFPITSFADFQTGLAWANDTTLSKPSNSNVGSLLIGYVPDGATNLKDTSLKLDPYAKFSNVALEPKPTVIDSSSSVKNFATDVYSFQIEPVYGRHLTDMDGDSTNGKQTRVILNFPKGIKATTYLKKNRAGQWFSFLDDQKLETWDEGATLINLDNDPSTIERIILTIRDGGIGDYDGIVNDTIIDPGALGEMNPIIVGVNIGRFYEGLATGTVLYDINDANSGIDKDAEGQDLKYRFALNTDTLITKAIALDSLTGKLSVKNKDDFDFEAFVANGQAILQFDITASDPNDNISSAKYILELLNVDEYPKILNGRNLSFVEKDSVSKPVVTIKALPDYQDITTFEILNEGDGTSFNINKNTGIIKFNITPVFKTKENYQFSIKALDNVGHTDTAHFNVAIIPLPPAPVIGDTAVYKLNASSAPASFTTLVSQPVDGALIRWHFAGATANNWVDTLPRLPDSVGRYNYVIKTYDPYTHLFSKDSTVVNIVIRPLDPITLDSTYIIGAKNNPTNVAIQVSGMPRNIFNYFKVDSVLTKVNSIYGSSIYQNKITSIANTAPPLPKLPGKYKYSVNQMVNTVDSDTIPFLVNMIQVKDVLHVYYKIDTPKLQSNSTFNIPMQIVLTNKLSKSIDSVQLQASIKDMMPIGADFKVLSIKGTGSIKENKSFDGAITNSLLAQGVSMAALSSDTIKVLINFIPNGFSGTLLNTALMNARSPYGWVEIKSDKTPAGYTYEPTPVEIPEVFLKIPEIFTPNRDGINDKFVIVRPFGMTIDLEVYNRWGSIVYANRDYQNEWDGKGSGTILGQDLVDGGYYYKIKATNQKGETQFFNGYVVIQR